jgi:hypothetical protein
VDDATSQQQKQKLAAFYHKEENLRNSLKSQLDGGQK